jgi:hypothetical protein
MDYGYRWKQNSAEYQWLKHDLQSHPSQLKFAIWHYPLFSDNFTEPSDTYLQGANALEGCWRPMASTWSSTGTRTCTSAT